jgi:hypothetical protein
MNAAGGGGRIVYINPNSSLPSTRVSKIFSRMLLVGEEGLFKVTQIPLLSPSFTQSFQDIFMNAAGGRGRIVYINPNSSSLPFLHPDLPRYLHECCWSERKDCLHKPKFFFSPLPSPRSSKVFS